MKSIYCRTHSNVFTFETMDDYKLFITPEAFEFRFFSKLFLYMNYIFKTNQNNSEVMQHKFCIMLYS